MKKSELKELNFTELNEKLRENLESLQNYKFQLSMQQLEDFTVISKTKKEIAQIKTVMNEHKYGIRKVEDV